MAKRCTRDDVYSFITKAGLEGRTFGEIQRFVVEKNGLNYDEKLVKRPWRKTEVRRYRGYWCTNLCGNNNYGHKRQGILELATVRVGNRYVSKQFADLV